MANNEALVQFCLNWSLSEEAQASLMKLSPEAQAKVIQEFSPFNPLGDVSAELLALAEAQLGGTRFAADAQLQAALEAGGALALSPGEASEEQQLQDFCNRWALNSDAQGKLRKLTPKVQQLVMAQFAPAPHMMECSGKFIMFAASIEKAHAGGGSAYKGAAALASKGVGRGPTVDEAQIIAFCERWALNEDAVAKLRQLPPEMQHIAMSGFSPPPQMTEVSGKFIMYAASIAKARSGPGGQQYSDYGFRQTPLGNSVPLAWHGNEKGGWNESSQDELEFTKLAFSEHWGLNADAWTKLQKLSPEVQHIVMAEFAPPAHLTEVSGRFITFAASIERGHATALRGGRSKDERYYPPQPMYPRDDMWYGPAYPPVPYIGEEQLLAFVQGWGLNADAQRKLRKIPPEVQAVVMAQFAPPPGMQEVSGKFIMFASSLEKAHATRGLRAYESAGGFYPGPTDEGQLLFFCQQWGLNEDAQTKLRKLRPDVQQLVMAGFKPPPNLGEVNGKFIMFATSIEKAHKGSGGPWAPQRRPYPEPHWQGPEPKRWKGMQPAPDMEEFILKWGLNDDAVAKLNSLPPYLLEMVMREFQPKGTPHDDNGWSGKFISYASQVQKYSQQQQSYWM